VGCRGGSGVIWGNVMGDIGGGAPGINFSVFAINLLSTIPCQTAYPAARQTGQGWSASSTATYGNPVVTADGTGAVTEGVWIWNNTGAGPQDSDFIQLNQPSDDQCGNGQLVSNYIQEGRDYFLSAKPGYTPYTYPHPLHTQYALASAPAPTPTPAAPAAPQDLRVVN